MMIKDLEDLLSDLGIEVTGTRGNEVQAKCPGHLELTGKEDRNPSWSINADTGAHICFSCGFKGGLQFLVNYMGGVEYNPESKEEGNKYLRRAYEQMMKSLNHVEEEQKFIDESMLAIYTAPPVEALKSRGILPMVADMFGILWDPRVDNWIIPIRDPKSRKLMGWQEKGYATRFFRNQPNGVQKSRALFGYSEYRGGDMILVESPLDVARLASVGVFGGVAAYGAMVSRDQLRLLESSERLVIALDNDEAGSKSSESLFDWAKETRMSPWFFNYDGIDVKDVGAMSKSEIMMGLENARHILRGKRECLWMTSELKRSR